MAGEEKLKGFGRVNRRRVQESLGHFAFEVLKLGDLVLRFGALSHNFESKAVREQVLCVQARVLNLVLSKIRGRGLQYFQEAFRFCHVERQRDVASILQRRSRHVKSLP